MRVVVGGVGGRWEGVQRLQRARRHSRDGRQGGRTKKNARGKRGGAAAYPPAGVVPVYRGNEDFGSVPEHPRHPLSVGPFLHKVLTADCSQQQHLLVHLVG